MIIFELYTTRISIRKVTNICLNTTELLMSFKMVTITVFCTVNSMTGIRMWEKNVSSFALYLVALR